MLPYDTDIESLLPQYCSWQAYNILCKDTVIGQFLIITFKRINSKNEQLLKKIWKRVKTKKINVKKIFALDLSLSIFYISEGSSFYIYFLLHYIYLTLVKL